MGEVKYGHGYAWRVKKGGKRENVEDLGEALRIKADCGPCGCDDCLGLWTQISATTGELVGMYVIGDLGGPYTVVIEDYDTALANTKALKAART